MNDQQPWWNQPAADKSSADEPTPTRAYDLNADGAAGQSESAGSRGASEPVDATSRYDTDDLNYVRQPSPATRAEEPTQVLPAAVPPAAPPAAPAPVATRPQPNSAPQWHNPQYAAPAPQPMPAERDLRTPGYQMDHRGVNVMAVLEDGTSGPSGGARVAAMVIGALAGIVMLLMNVEPYIPDSNIMLGFSQWLMSMFNDELIVAGVVVGIIGLLKLVVVFSAMLSGLAPMVFGLIVFVQGVVLTNLASDQYDVTLGGTLLPRAIVEAALFLALALVVHVVRGAGYRKALRLVRQASRR